MNTLIGKARLNFSDESAMIIFADQDVASKSIDVNVISDLGPGNNPLSIEIIGLMAQLGSKAGQELIRNLNSNKFRYSFDEESDAMLISLNTAGASPITQQPYTTRFLFDGHDNLVSIELKKRASK